MPIRASELILNQDGSVYHLNLKPEHIAQDIIFVGDQDRVEQITQYFETIEFSTQKREFKTQTGFYHGKKLTVLSTGIGTDNIDIVLNELDALVNIDLETRQPKSELTSLNIVRVGTSGALQYDIPVDSFLLSTHGLDLSGMLHYYKRNGMGDHEMMNAFMTHMQWPSDKARPLVFENSSSLQKKFDNPEMKKGITATAGGFYGPQGRVLRLEVADADLNAKLDSFQYDKYRITNFEMETAMIYGLSKLLGHQAVSLNAIIANRANGTFSSDPMYTIDSLIKYTLLKFVN